MRIATELLKIGRELTKNEAFSRIVINGDSDESEEEESIQEMTDDEEDDIPPLVSRANDPEMEEIDDNKAKTRKSSKQRGNKNHHNERGLTLTWK